MSFWIIEKKIWKISKSQILAISLQCSYNIQPSNKFLFLIIVVVLSRMVDKEMAEGRIEGIRLLYGNKHQTLTQYVDDTSLILLGNKEKVCNMIYIMETFVWQHD